MDSAQRKHLLGQFARISQDPEAASLARTFFAEGNSAETVGEKTPWIRQIGQHWIVALVAGVGVSYQGPYDVQVRWVVLSALYVWLVWDSWIILANRPSKNKDNHRNQCLLGTYFWWICISSSHWRHAINERRGRDRSRDQQYTSARSSKTDTHEVYFPKPWRSRYTAN